MHSHRYAFTARDLARCLGTPLGGLCLWALVLHSGVWTHVWPAPRPTPDLDRTVLTHQAEASRTTTDAAILLVGDSSCLMDVAADALGQALATPALNLGTLSYLSLDSASQLLEVQARTADEALPPRAASPTVVLLLHPEALRVRAPSSFHTAALTAALAGRDLCDPTTRVGRLEWGLGFEVFRGRLASRWVPAPLGGEYGSAYGFTHDFWRHLARHRGSAIDPHRYDPATDRGSSDYRLAPSLQAESMRFRRALPRGWRLAVGITPVPVSHALPTQAETGHALLRTSADWLGAEAMLDGLPFTLPDALFASVTHLNARGQALYTARLADALRASGLVAEAGVARPR